MILVYVMMAFPIFTLYARSRLRILLCTSCFVAALGIVAGISQGYRGDGIEPLLMFCVEGNLVFIILTNVAGSNAVYRATVAGLPKYPISVKNNKTLPPFTARIRHQINDTTAGLPTPSSE